MLDTNYFFSTETPNYLLAILNSNLITWWINSEDTQLGNGGAWRHYKYNLEKLHIPQLLGEFDTEVRCILQDAEMKKNVSLINRKVYKLYSLTKEEEDFIESLLSQ